ncbi:MFS transporter [Arsenicicoccus piscis]|uniref:MFS transporter n=1 Tax=Arsenicicoccus piscis TaxID=673954 RepID=A0ABQ6HRA9_9MICO|nr:MFS transporter [Arsenicicoccus piscis]MCH8627967.1 MFS transporter [Arsenicicoccus piscis]GMA20692.1 MFS transporter [Arsenicicoccus piscis]
MTAVTPQTPADEAPTRSMFASLAVPNYRLYFAGGLLSNVGTWMGRVAQDWLVLTQLTDHSSTALGTVTGLQFAPVLLLAPWSGVVADRFPKRRILLVTQSALLVTAAMLYLLVATGTCQLWHVYLLAFAQGIATAFDNPTRQAFASELVDAPLLTNAVSLNSASFNAARLIGPGVAGLLIAALGVGPALGINALSFVAVIIALLALSPEALHPAPARRGRGALREGLSYVRHRPDIMIIMAIVFVLGTFGMNFQITNALMATQVYGAGASEYGILGSVMAIGSLSAALLAARRSRPRLRVLLGALGGFAIVTFALALAPSYPVYAVLLVPTGLMALTVLTTANAAVQLSVTPAMRGRVMSLYMAIFMGGTPLGAPIIGWIGDAWGARWTILVGSIATGLAFLAAVAYIMGKEGLRLHLDRRQPLWLDVEHLSVDPTALPQVPERPAHVDTSEVANR